MKALVIGATGATGKDLVQQLLNDKDFEAVDIFVRKPIDIQNDKLNVHVVNFEKPEE
jgi:dTDP-4-dehydrorhamnose reductase